MLSEKLLPPEHVICMYACVAIGYVVLCFMLCIRQLTVLFLPHKRARLDYNLVVFVLLQREAHAHIVYDESVRRAPHTHTYAHTHIVWHTH